MMRYTFAFSVAALLVGTAAADSQTKGGAVLVSSGGKCERLLIARKAASCDKILYMSVPPSRVNFTVPLQTGALSISGGKSIQPNLNDFVLLIDKILYNGRAYAARGKCEANVSDSGDLLHSVACAVKTEFGDIEMIFRGNGRKVKIDHIPAR